MGGYGLHRAEQGRGMGRLQAGDNEENTTQSIQAKSALWAPATAAITEQDRFVSGQERWRRERQRTVVQWISVAWDDSAEDVLAGCMHLSCGIARAEFPASCE